MARTYDQFCPAARALDVVGGRWTLLVVRELTMGPRRYTDLLAGLPGIGPNVLADRLSELRAHGVVDKTVAPVHGAALYELTAVGEQLRPVVDALNTWGMRLLDQPRPGEHVKLDWLLACVRASFRPELAAGIEETYQFRVDGEYFHLVVRDSSVQSRHGVAGDPAFTLECGLSTFLAIGGRVLSVDDALAAGIGTFTGDVAAAKRAVALVGPHFESAGASYGIYGAVRAKFVPEAARDVAETYEFRIGEQVFASRIAHGEIEVVPGPAAQPAVSLSTDLASFLSLASGALTVRAGVDAGAIEVTGDLEAAVRLAAVFDLPLE